MWEAPSLLQSVLLLKFSHVRKNLVGTLEISAKFGLTRQAKKFWLKLGLLISSGLSQSDLDKNMLDFSGNAFPKFEQIKCECVTDSIGDLDVNLY